MLWQDVKNMWCKIQRWRLEEGGIGFGQLKKVMVAFYATHDYNPPLPVFAIAMTMAASDCNRDAIVICVEKCGEAVWRGGYLNIRRILFTQSRLRAPHKSLAAGNAGFILLRRSKCCNCVWPFFFEHVFFFCFHITRSIFLILVWILSIQPVDIFAIRIL